MPGYHERLRDLENTRWLMRDFLVCGFRTRNEQKLSSARTYDDERRRIESLLGDTLSWRQGEGGKQYFISAESAQLSANPLHKIWRLRTFTDNDLLLHCLLLACLKPDRPMTLMELANAISDYPVQIIDVQTLRRKLQEYEGLGLVRSRKEGNRLLYALSDMTLDALFPDEEGAEECLAFFREALPMGSLADSLMLRRGYENRYIRFKHHFLMHTLDDDVMLSLLEILHARQAVQLTCDGQRADSKPHQVNLLPVCVRVSEETGRRYLIGYDMDRHASRSVRLDLIRGVVPADPPQDLAACVGCVRKDLANGWGISMNSAERLAHLEMDVRIDLEREGFVLDRLRREGRGGKVTRIDWDIFRYETDVTDTLEMMRWIRTFTGRIVSLRDSSGQADKRFREDMEQLRRMYAKEDERHDTV